ncbi:MAG: imidazoleglycerol-phosphate dehydratase HisB [Halodesulfurarchaeum sp.]|nr:imidazoleglycerol-phosphate dehydratase HisB [Halodesulfurarchaeum sp.]
MSERQAARKRETAETEISVTVDLDGTGETTVDTGVGFFDHMLTAFARHGYLDLTVRCAGDLDVDEHHTVEDVGIVLGQAIDEALGERRAIRRFADRTVPMDEARATVVLDVSGRPYFEATGAFSQDRVGEFTSVLGTHFVRSLAEHAGLTLQVDFEGENAHHEIEALFKALGVALDDATRLDDRRSDAPSTKGTIE